MKPTAFLQFVHDIEDGWYNMQEPNGLKASWGLAINAYNYAKQQGWECVWVGDTRYKPKFMDEPHFGDNP